MRKLTFIGFAILMMASTIRVVAGDAGVIPAPNHDPHSTEIGFFDIHVCNWPDRPLFFLGLLGTTQYERIERVRLFTPQGEPIGSLDLSQYRLIQNKKEKDKKVFIKHFNIPEDADNGWYIARILLEDGRQYEARDYVIIHHMDRAGEFEPADQERLSSKPRILRWKPVPGAKYYRVFIRDPWKGSLVFKSEFLDEPKLKLPKDLLEIGGEYVWRVHARDVNGSALLGDFNHGSLSRKVRFFINR